MPLGTLLIRADASHAMGHGHVMRCLALAQAWQDRGGDCMFAMAEPLPGLEARLRAENIRVTRIAEAAGSTRDAGQLAELARNNRAPWVVIDGYQFSSDYQRVLKNAGLRVLAMDDYGRVASHVADIVLDQNAGASPNFYANRAPGTRLLLGSRHAMLRREFRSWRNWKREIPPTAQKILITMGGSDPQNLALRAIQALDFLHTGGVEATVVLGRHNPHIQQLESIIKHAKCPVKIAIDPGSMPELMASADVAISSAGSTCWEMCFLGLPAFVIDVAENQQPIAQELDRRGISTRIRLGDATAANIAAQVESLLISAKQRQKMSCGGRELIDGRGTERVVAAMRVADFTLRPAVSGDSRLLWQWANDSAVRQASFSPSTISWQEHQEWFAKKIADPSSLVLMFQDKGDPVAVVRTQADDGGEAEISFTIAPDYRGQGLASALLDRFLEKIFETTSVRRVHAFIKPENSASSRSFENAGFRRLENSRLKGCDALHYVREWRQESAPFLKQDERPREVVPC